MNDIRGKRVGLDHLAKSITDLSDEEITQTFQVIYACKEKYSHRPATQANLASLSDEITTRCAELGVLVHCTEAHMLTGEPFQVEIAGKVGTVELFDHEHKGWEVNKAKDRSEEWLGEKEPVNKRRKKA